MKQIISILVLMVVLLPSRGVAQSLSELINAALERNYQISITKNEAAIASNNNTMGNAGQLPTVNFNGTYSNSFNNTRQQFADGSIREGNNARNVNGNFSVMARWTLFNGFTVHAKKDQLTYLEELGQQNSRYYIEQTVSDIVTAYYQLVYETQLLEHYRQLLNFSAYRLNIETRRKEIGAGKLINYGQALVDYQSDSILLLAQQNVIQTLTIEINRVLNNDLERELIVADREITLLDLPPKEEFLAAVDQRNSLLERQRLQELIAETELRMEKAYRYPKVDLFAGYQYNRTFSEVGFFRSNQNFGPTAGLTVSFNLYNGGNTTRAIKNTEIYRENTRLSKEQVTVDLHADVLSLYYQYLSVRERVELARSNVETINSVYKTAEQQLKEGAINGYEFRLTQLTLLNSELTLTRLQFILKSIEINLNRLSGAVLEAYL